MSGGYVDEILGGGAVLAVAKGCYTGKRDWVGMALCGVGLCEVEGMIW